MKKLFTLVALIAGLASGQTYNVAITNSLLGPVDVTISEAIITGAVVNASVTNSFAPVNNVTSIVNVGSTTVNNTNIFDNVITNIINNNITNVIQNIVQSNNYFVTSGVSSISFTGAVDGAIVLAAGNNITIAQTNRTFNISSTASGGGGLVYLQETNGTATSGGAFLFPTQNISAGTFGLFIGTNDSISVNRPDGTIDGGNARGRQSVDLQGDYDGTLTTRSTASQVVSARSSFMAASYRSTISSASPFNTVLGGNNGGGVTISGGEGSAIIASAAGTISGGNNSFVIGSPASVTINATQGSGIIGGAGGVGNGTIAGYGSVSVASDGLQGMSAASYNTFIAATRYAAITGTTVAAAAHSAVIAGEGSTNGASRSFISGSFVKNSHAGNFIWGGYDGSTTTLSSTATNRVLFRTQGFGINTNNPQESLHVSGRVQIDGVKIYASGTNLFLTDGSTFTNRIDVVPQ